MTAPATRFDVDLGAIAANVRAIRAMLGKRAWLCAALKADAYGFGLLPVAKAVAAAGVSAIGVGSVEDGIRLRASGIRKPVLVYGGDLLTASSVREHEHHNLIATVHDASTLDISLRSARSALEVMIEVDVGLTRLGFDPESVSEVAARVRSSPRATLRGIYTHMRVPAQDAAPSLRLQFARFQAALAAAGPVPVAMAASSRVLDIFPDMALEAVDVGRAVYGLLPRKGGRLGPRLRPAFAGLRSCLIAVKVVDPERNSPETRHVNRLGIIPFGRAAGMADLGAGAVLVAGRPARLVGAPSLQQMRIDLSRHPRARVGDEVVIVGRQGRTHIGIEDVLRAHPEIPDSAIALQVRDSVPRVYLNGRRG